MSFRNCIVILVLFLCSAAAVSAQDEMHELSAMAMRAAQVAKPSLATTPNIFWERLRPTRQSNLGCPLVEGTDLGREVRPYIMEIRYPGEKYVIYIAEDGSLSQPCDPKFDSLSAVIPATLTPWPTSTLLPATLTPTMTPTPLPLDLMCPPNFTGFLAPRILLGRATTRVGAGDVSNRLRDIPNVSGTQIGQIAAGRTINQVLGGPACSGTYVWWFVEVDGVQGWTAESDSSNSVYFLEPMEGFPLPTTVPTVSTSVPVIGQNLTPGVTPSLPLTPTMTLTPMPTATTLPVAFTCPPDFAGFLAPRLVRGQATARVGDGDVPNRLRDEPSVSGTQVGQIQPGRTINQVLAGPACSETYVWWFVEMDGIQGWTVESNSADGGTYFLEPLDGSPFPTLAPVVPTATPETIDGLFHAITLDGESAYEIRFWSDTTVIVQGGSSLYVWNTDGAEPALQKIPNVKAFDETQDTLYGVSWKALITAKKSNLTDVITVPNEELNPFNTVPAFSITRDGRYFLTTKCNNEDCFQGAIDLWETASNTLLRSQPAHNTKPLAWFTPDDTHILSMASDGLQVWDTHTGAFLGGVALPMGEFQHTLPVISPDSAFYYIAACTEIVDTLLCKDGKLQLQGWSIATSELVTAAALSQWEGDVPKMVYSLAMSSDGRHLAIGFVNGTIQFWSLDPVTHALTQGETLDVSASIPANEGTTFMIGALAFNPDGTQIAVGVNGNVQIWTVPQP